MNDIKRIAINTGGGDAPGLNAVIHAAVHAARNHDWEIFGIRDGFDGLLHPENYPDGGLIKLTRPLVRNIAHLGGTILGTSNYGNPFKLRVPQPDGSFKEIDRSDELVRSFPGTPARRAHFHRRRRVAHHRARLERKGTARHRRAQDD